ncbi:MAG TPA: type II toxin-antitoxin system HipA family toxin [Gaiellaceae bacterium]
MTVAAVNLWGSRIGAVAIDSESRAAVFQYEPDFVDSGIQVSPLVMPLRIEPYTFPTLNDVSFRGLPGLLADSLPDRYGNALIDTWLARQGRSPSSFDAVERLCYIGQRGMGALEFAPGLGPQETTSKDIDIDALVELASEVLTHRENLLGALDDAHKEQTLRDILSIGTSAGGARAKAVIAWNPQTQIVRSGQIAAGPGFEYWLLKFDGVSGNKDKELEDPKGYGAIEFAYFNMAQAAGITMTNCRLLEENGRRHFMTRRFDREPDGSKRHLQSLAALAHYDFNRAGSNSYEQALQVLRRLDLSMDAVEQQFRRMVFNVIARNQDDHVKNIAFLMNREGRWELSPAFDVTYAWRPSGAWTDRHQMSINGKRDDFSLDDFDRCADTASMKRGRARTIVDEVRAAVVEWPAFASAARVDESDIARVQRGQRLQLHP